MVWMASKVLDFPAVALGLMIAAPAAAQHLVAPVFKTPAFPAGNVDSCASWVPGPGPSGETAGEPLLFVTEKDGGRAATGEAYAPRRSSGLLTARRGSTGRTASVAYTSAGRVASRTS
jgi:hypothetical protein